MASSLVKKLQEDLKRHQAKLQELIEVQGQCVETINQLTEFKTLYAPKATQMIELITWMREDFMAKYDEREERNQQFEEKIGRLEKELNLVQNEKSWVELKKMNERLENAEVEITKLQTTQICMEAEEIKELKKQMEAMEDQVSFINVQVEDLNSTVNTNDNSIITNSNNSINDNDNNNNANNNANVNVNNNDNNNNNNANNNASNNYNDNANKNHNKNNNNLYNSGSSSRSGSNSMDNSSNNYDGVFTTVSSSNLGPSDINVICTELQLRQQKRRNLMVFGLKETEKDDDTIKDLMEDIGVGVDVESHFRVGKAKNYPRPVVMRFASENDRLVVESNLRKLKGKANWNRVSIVPDLTKLQCIEEKEKFRILQAETQKKNEENLEGGYYKIVGRRGSKHCIYIP